MIQQCREHPPAAQPVQSADHLQQVLAEQTQRVRNFYDDLAERQVAWNNKYRYYRNWQRNLIKHFVVPGSRVLDIGCGPNDLLASLDVREGVGVDCSPVMVDVAQRRHPQHQYFVGSCEELDQSGIPDGPYDYITMVNVVGEMVDIVKSLQQAHRYCSRETRLIIVQYSYLWEPICRLAARLGLHLDNPAPNWLSHEMMRNVLRLGGFEVARQGWTLPFPLRLPGINWLVNSFLGRMYGFRGLGFLSYVVARPIMHLEHPSSYTCSVVVPCKNEEENIDEIVRRVPQMGAGTQLVFVDDRSTDETALRIQNAIERNPHKDICMLEGPGQGKGAACRAGFKAAKGDVLMILDADMTVMPEELPAFFEAITTGKGEFINGSRMVYPMEAQAMRNANVFGNKFFAIAFKLLLEQPIGDTLCGTKAIWRSDYPKIMQARKALNSCDVWGDYDWIFGAAKNNLKIIDLPVHYRERKAGETKMTRQLRNAWFMLKMCGLALRKLRWV